jgi:CRP/FNR family cyclic AMP-dependent transcriptional regulator
MISISGSTSAFTRLGIDEDAAAAIAVRARVHRVCTGAVLQVPGAPADGLSVVMDGSVRLYRLDAAGAETVLGHLGAGDVFGEARAGTHACFAEAVTDAWVCAIDSAALEAVASEHPRAALRLMAALAERINGMADQLERAARWGVRERLVALLLREMDEAGEVRGLTHEQMAAAVWATRQTITQELSALAAEGLVGVGRRRVLLREPGVLRASIEAQPAPRRSPRRR